MKFFNIKYIIIVAVTVAMLLLISGVKINAQTDVGSGIQNTGSNGNNSAVTKEYTDAQNTISSVLGVQVLCEEQFLNTKATQDCINFEVGDFISIINNIDDGLKNQLTPLRDTTKIYPGPLYNKEELEIQPIDIPSVPTDKTGCQWNFSVLKVTGKPLARTYTIAFESCGLDISNNQLLEIRNGLVSSKLSGTIPIRTLLSPVNQTFYLI